MRQIALKRTFILSSLVRDFPFLLLFLAGLLAPLGFAPFHLPGLTMVSLAILYHALINNNLRYSIVLSFFFGLGYYGLGVSWVIVSIHDYGQINYFLSAFITLLFISYLSLFPVALSLIFKLVTLENSLLSCIFFSSLWCLSEYLRATLMTGFPWLIVGITQLDTPLRFLAPILGLYGLSFLVVLAATLLSLAVSELTIKRYYYLLSGVLIIISPSLLKNIQWTHVNKKPITVAAIQGNLSMRDKWDEHLFRQLLKFYKEATLKLLGNQLIILPESAIPIPANYLHTYLSQLHKSAMKGNSALLLGILQPTNESETHYYTAMSSYGHANGQHLKKQLVPFGEYIPKPFVTFNRWLNLPEPNILSGHHQELIKIFNHPIASLICYEIAYTNILAEQMPEAEWIVSISDNGWFGKSLASYQQQQMAQFLSLLVGRYHVVVNNDGLSSIIDNRGNIVESLPAFSRGILHNVIFSAFGRTPWLYWQDAPVLLFCLICVFFILIYRIYYYFQR